MKVFDVTVNSFDVVYRPSATVPVFAANASEAAQLAVYSLNQKMQKYRDSVEETQKRRDLTLEESMSMLERVKYTPYQIEHVTKVEQIRDEVAN